MAIITTSAGMRDYVKLMLGSPVVNVELHDSQIDQVIENECQVFSRYCYEEGNYSDNLITIISAGICDYPISGLTDKDGRSVDNVLQVYNISNGDFLDNLNVMFTPTHILLHQEWVENRRYPSGPGQGMINDGLTLTNYSIAMMYLKEVTQLFGKQYTARFIPGRNIIRLNPTPNEAMICVITVYRKLEDEYLYNHPIVKRLCTGAAKKLWGRFIMGKYIGTLPDGLSLNGDAIYADGEAEYNSALEDCKMESYPVDFFIG